MSKEKELYNQATKHIDELVDEIVQQCIDFANDNHYEEIWVLERFRARFNTAIRNAHIA